MDRELPIAGMKIEDPRHLVFGRRTTNVQREEHFISQLYEVGPKFHVYRNCSEALAAEFNREDPHRGV
jgi:hypothetical protein